MPKRHGWNAPTGRRGSGRDCRSPAAGGTPRFGRYEEALACAQRQVDINREGGYPVGEQYSMSNVVAIELLLDRPEAALEHGRAAIVRLDALGAGVGAGHLHWT